MQMALIDCNTMTVTAYDGRKVVVKAVVHVNEGTTREGLLYTIEALRTDPLALFQAAG